MKKEPKEQAPQLSQNNSGREFKTFAYYAAWIGFLGAFALAVSDILKKQEAPKKDDYYK